MDWGRKWLVDFNVEKTQLVLFDWSKNAGAYDVKMDGTVLEEKINFSDAGVTICSKLDWSSHIISITKTASKEIGALICSMNVFTP